jgi:hypothetical protein
VAHHQEADGVHAQLSGVFNVLLRDIRLSAVGSHSDDSGAGVVGVVQVVDGADAGQQQGGDFGVFDDFSDRFDPLQIGVGAEAVVEAEPCRPSPWATSMESTLALSRARAMSCTFLMEYW